VGGCGYSYVCVAQGIDMYVSHKILICMCRTRALIWGGNDEVWGGYDE